MSESAGCQCRDAVFRLPASASLRHPRTHAASLLLMPACLPGTSHTHHWDTAARHLIPCACAWAAQCPPTLLLRPYLRANAWPACAVIFNVVFNTAAADALIITMFLDNTIPGTLQERGLHVWLQQGAAAGDWWADDRVHAVCLAPCVHVPAALVVVAKRCDQLVG